MKNLQEVITETDKSIEKVFETQFQYSVNDDLNLIFKDILKLKRQYDRALISRLVCEMLDGDWKVHSPIWAVLESIDCAILALDDIIDHSKRRLNNPTIHYKYGIEKTLCAIEHIKSQAISLSVDHCKKFAPDKIGDVVLLIEAMYQGINEGQFIDKFYEEKNISEITIENIIDMVGLTTGIQIAVGAELGALFANKNKIEQKIFKEFGSIIGTLFQIRDDFIDYFEDEDIIGKPPYLDIADKKKRFPIVLLYQKTPDKSLKEKIEKYCINDTINLNSPSPIEPIDTVDVEMIESIKRQLASDEIKGGLTNIVNPLYKRAIEILRPYSEKLNHNILTDVVNISTDYF